MCVHIQQRLEANRINVRKPNNQFVVVESKISVNQIPPEGLRDVYK